MTSPVFRLLVTLMCAYVLLGLALLARGGVHLQIITVRTEADLNTLFSHLRSEQNFSDLARKYSSHPTAENGGYLGEMNFHDLAEFLRDRVAGMKEGSVTHFFHPQMGYVVLRKLSEDTAKSAYASAAVVRGTAHLKARNTDDAIKEFREALSLNPESAPAHMLLGYAYRQLGSYQMIGEAKAELRQALALDPSLAGARYQLAKTYLDLGRPAKARQALEEQPEITQKVPRLTSLLGEVYRQLGNPEQSVQHNRKALNIDPSLAIAHYHLGLAYLDLNQDEDALRALNLATGSKSAEMTMYVTAGSVYLKKMELDRAVEVLEKAVQLQPSTVQGRILIAQAYRLKGQLDRALNHLQAALSGVQQILPVSPSSQRLHSQVYLEAGRVYQAMKLWSEAVRSYLELLRVDPEHGEGHRQLAEVLFHLGDYSPSIHHAFKAQELGSPLETSLFERIKKSQDTPR